MNSSDGDYGNKDLDVHVFAYKMSKKKIKKITRTFR